MSETTHIIIRRAEKKDTEKISQMLTGICELHRSGRPDIFRPGQKYSPAELEEIFANNEKPVFVADDGNGAIGYVFCVIKLREEHAVFNRFVSVWVDDLFVSPQYRKQGVGNMLFNSVRKLARSIGANNIELNVWSFNDNAIGFYKSLGMTPQRTIMELPLGKPDN